MHAAPRIEAAAAAAATLDAACAEVAQSDLLRSVLKTALLAGAVQAQHRTCLGAFACAASAIYKPTREILAGFCTSEVALLTVLASPYRDVSPAANFLNAGNQNGAAAGFQLDALLKLKDVRSSRARCEFSRAAALWQQVER